MSQLRTSIQNKGGRPAGSIDPLSSRTRHRLINSLLIRAEAGDVEATKALVEISERTIKLRHNKSSEQE